MSGSDLQDDDRPLTPEQQQVLNRARLAFAITMGLIVVGFITIAGVVVYRVSRSAPPPPSTVAAQSVSLPSGANVISVTVGEGTIAATYSVGPSVQVRVFDAATGKLRHQFDVLTK